MIIAPILITGIVDARACIILFGIASTNVCFPVIAIATIATIIADVLRFPRYALALNALFIAKIIAVDLA